MNTVLSCILAFCAAAAATYATKQADASCAEGASAAVLYLLQHDHLDGAPDIDYLVKESCK